MGNERTGERRKKTLRKIFRPAGRGKTKIYADYLIRFQTRYVREDWRFYGHLTREWARVDWQRNSSTTSHTYRLIYIQKIGWKIRKEKSWEQSNRGLEIRRCFELRLTNSRSSKKRPRTPQRKNEKLRAATKWNQQMSTVSHGPSRPTELENERINVLYL